MNEFQTENKEFNKDKTNENLINQQIRMNKFKNTSIFDKIEFHVFSKKIHVFTFIEFNNLNYIGGFKIPEVKLTAI